MEVSIFSLVASILLFPCVGSRITIPLTRHRLTSPVAHPISTTLVSTSTGASYTIKLNNSYDLMYTGPVKIGTPLKTFDVIFDTGSADLWIFAADNECNTYLTCSSTAICRTSEGDCCFFKDTMHAYDSSTSSTYEDFDPQETWSIQYGKGSASGYLVYDSVSLGGQSVTSQVFAAATAWSEDMVACGEPMDGILGLAMEKASESGYDTVIENLYSQGRISEKMFSMRLSDGNDHVNPSLMIIGPPDDQYYVDDLIYTDVVEADETGMWFIEYVGFLYTPSTNSTLTKSNAVWIDTCEDSEPCFALVDSGTSYITMPSSEYDTLVSYITSVAPDCEDMSGIYVCPLSSLALLPNLWIQINDKAFVLSPQDYMTNEGCTNNANYYCLAISWLDQLGDHVYIFGDTFLRRYYVVFDESHSKIGFGSMYTLEDALERPGESSVWRQVEIVVAVLGALSILCCVCAAYFKYKRPQRTRASSISESEIPYTQAKEHRLLAEDNFKV